MTQKQMTFSKDLENKKMHIEREFDGNLSRVWAAWTQSEILDQWWAPKPWKAETKTQDFKEGGYWLYAMRGPEGEAHWARANYKNISPEKSFTVDDAFCDENGTINKELPTMNWVINFSPIGSGTKVAMDITLPSKEHLEKILEMGFKEGFEMGLGNLDELLQSNIH